MMRRLLLCMLLSIATPAMGDVDIDNIDDFIGAGTTTCSNVTTAGAVTLMGWVRNNSLPGTLNNACNFNSPLIRDSGRFNALGPKSTTQYCYGSNDGAFDEFVAVLSAGWHHLAGTHAAGTLTFYIDGVSAGTIASGNNGCTTDTFLYGNKIGNRIAGIMIFNVALNAEEITNIAKRRQLGPMKTMPTVDVRLDSCADGASGDAVTFPDRSGNGNNGLGDNGAEGAGVGLICRASEYFRREWGPQ